MDEDLQFKKLFKDICVGASSLKTEFATGFIKHVSIFEQNIIDEARIQYINRAKSMGLPTVEEALNDLYEESYWTKNEENQIAQEELFIKKLYDQKKNTYLKSQIDSFNKQIEDSLKKVNELKNKRNSFLGNTCENFADQKITEDFLKNTLFKDSDCKIPLYSDQEFDEIPVGQLGVLIHFYNILNKEASDLNIQKMVLRDFYSYYMPYCEDPIHFFGRPITQLTFNQIKMLLYSRYFKNILTSNDNIPDEYRKDPEKIIDYVNANEKAKQVKQKAKDGQAESIVGATKEDYDYINMKKGKVKSLSLAEEAKKKGGSLDMKDLMNLMGV